MTEQLKPCLLCGKKPVIERWASGGMMYMVKCNNPDCPVPEDGYPSGRNLENIKEEWNRRARNDGTGSDMGTKRF